MHMSVPARLHQTDGLTILICRWLQTEGRTFREGDQLAAGDKLGKHIGAQTDSDIAVRLVRKEPWTLVSAFEIMTNRVFLEFQQHGIHSRCSSNLSPSSVLLANMHNNYIVHEISLHVFAELI